MTTVHIGLAVARHLTTRKMGKDMPRAKVLAALRAAGAIPHDMKDSQWDDETLRDCLVGIPEQVGVHDDAPRVMDISVSPDSTLLEAAAEVQTCWKVMAADGQSPLWVWSDNDALAFILANSLGGPASGDAPIGVPKDVEATSYTQAGPPGVDNGQEWGALDKSAARTARKMDAQAVVVDPAGDLKMLHTSAGIDHTSRVGFDTASTGTGSYAAANYIALTENATAPVVGDTALTGELSGSGYTRAQATYAHTNGTTSVVMTKTFTSSDPTARTISKAGMLNASTVGTLAYSTAMPNPPVLVSGDTLALTWSFVVS